MNQLLLKREKPAGRARHVGLAALGLVLSGFAPWVCAAPTPATARATPAPVVKEAPKGMNAQVEESARAHLLDLAEREHWMEPRVTVSVATGLSAPPRCDGPIEVEPIDTRFPTRMRFAASCPGQWRQQVVVRADVSAQVLVAASNVPASQPIAEADLRLERRSVSATPDATSDPASVVGLSSRRSLRAGDIVRTQSLIAAVLVKRGDAVRIVARREQVEVTMSGEALDAGSKGALVRVRNTGTGKVIQAVVVEAGVVEPAQR